MSRDESRVATSDEESHRYEQFGGVTMERVGNTVYPDFRFEHNPAMSRAHDEPGYPLGDVPTGGDLEYAFEGEPRLYPEMDFRQLANELEAGETVPNTTYLTHAIHKHPAIFIPHIPSYIIRRFTDETAEDGDRPLILDPFSGSGTTGVEAKINGRDYLGIEINPLSRLVSEVATKPIPPSVLSAVRDRFVEELEGTDTKRYDAYDVEFLDRTDKGHWFTDEAIRDLTRIRKVTAEIDLDEHMLADPLTDHERVTLDDIGLSSDDLRTRVGRWLTLMVANTVFEVSNADPGISKAYKSRKMRRKIESDEHPPDVLDTHREQLEDAERRLTELWNAIYDVSRVAPGQQRLNTFGESGEPNGETNDRHRERLADNRAHRAETDIRLGDARTYSLSEYKEEVDLAVTSPPYINAMNYYRGSKLRLFWIRDLLSEDEKFDAENLRKSIIGSNSVSLSDAPDPLPRSLREVWTGTAEEYEQTRLPRLDEDVQAIHDLDQNTAERKAYVTWKFFAEDMLQSLARVYEHLKPGGYFFFIIGENTIGERLVHSHKYVADIARNLGKFEGHGADMDESAGFRLVGSAWDEITNRDLFRGRDHSGGVIECEWVVILQKPP